MIRGTLGAGKTETFVQNFIHQLLDKGFTAELPNTSELAMLTDEQLCQRLNDHIKTIQWEVFDILQQDRQRHKLR